MTLFSAAGDAAACLTAHRCAEAALFMREHMLSVVSHDLRGPLNAIHSWAYVLERKIASADPGVQRALDGIRHGVEQQLKLLETRVDGPRAQIGARLLRRQPVALQALFDEIVTEVHEALARERQVVLEVAALPPGTLAQVDGDPGQIANALWLMLVFAVESSVSATRVSLSASVDAPAQAWCVTVEFQALPAALTDPALPHLLEAYARQQAQEPLDAGQAAWVLTLCRRVAQAHDGRFEQQAAVAPGQAATLRLWLPLASA
ncbi:sensor histidine kinase [Paraburkholderia hayleyella]|uniref:sensor histidine kinase n=1 Tax=Paraburkholderia hayleyella TaxID=2152889 RepID=UPI001FED0DF5|nr:histidine kinase dimerization/phospho-acceptor domain-containing protein [Paraburkholderia hayleyella]